MQSIHSAVQSTTTFRFLRLRAARIGNRRKVLSFEGLEVRELFAVGDLRMVTYNVLGGDGTPSTDLGTILQAIGNENYNGRQRPIDVLAIQEVRTQSTTTGNVVAQLNAIYGAGVYARGNLNGAGTSGSGTVGLVYNTQTVQLLGEVGIGTPSTTGQPRQTIRYQLQPVGVPAGNDFYLYNSHYKASDTADDRARRLVEAQAIRANSDTLGNAHIIYAGDFNSYSSSEPGFQAIIGAGNGQGRDPLNRLGSWSDNSSFRDVFTQAPSTSPPPGFAAGGLDDRFDFQLLTGEWFDGNGLDYLTSSYHTFANNGSVAVNQSINSPSNTAIPGLANRTTILNLLTTVSDHLPVVADYFFNSTVVNTPPTDVNVDNSAVPENSPIGTPVGNLSTVDADFGDSFTYTLVGGTGSTDNSRFSIVGNQLRAAQVFNYESQSAYSVRIRTTDSQGEFFEESFIINISNLNENPTDVSLSSQFIAENLLPNTVIGMLAGIDPDSVNTFTFELVDGEGSSDNLNFTINGNQLQTATIFDYESRSSYTVRVRATDQGGLSVEKALTIGVTDANDSPAAVIFTPTSVNQFQSFQALGFADDQDLTQTHDFEWDFDYDGVNFDVDAIGDSPFFSYSTAGSYVIALRVSDNGSPVLTGIETAGITVNAQANTAPTITSIANQAIAANSATGPLNFTVGDAQTPAGSLTVTAASNNTALVPVANVVFGGSGANRTVNVTPVSGQFGTATITLTVSDGSLIRTTSFNVTVSAPVAAPKVESVVFGDGTVQRSMVKSITVTFDKVVTIDPNAFILQRRVGTALTSYSATELAIGVSTATESGKTIATLTFSGSLIVGGSLFDGNWQLSVLADHVHADGKNLDGNADGTAGDNFVKGAEAADNFFRLYGDINGSRSVNAIDSNQFRLANGTNSSSSAYRTAFDYQSNNAINALDANQFRLRNGTSLPS